MQSAALFLVLLVVGVALALPADPMMTMVMEPAAAAKQPMARAAAAGMDKKEDAAEMKKAGAGMARMAEKTDSASGGAEKKSSDDPSGENKYFPCEQGKVWFRKECVSSIKWSNGNTYYYGRR